MGEQLQADNYGLKIVIHGITCKNMLIKKAYGNAISYL